MQQFMKIIPKCKECDSRLETIAFAVKAEEQNAHIHIDYCTKCEEYILGKRYPIEKESDAVKQMFDITFANMKDYLGKMISYEKINLKK